MSRPAIDYTSLFGNFETHLYISILFAIRDQLVISDETKFYSIQGGSDLLVQSMVVECQAIESNRCSIVYSTPIAEVQLFESDLVRLTTKNGTSKVFDSVIVATTATAAQLIDFNPRAEFSDKYRVMRQLHYDCATKIVLFFNVSWWYTQENISGGRSITDLSVRFIYYPTTSSDQTGGGAIIASYTWSKDSIVWQSLSDSDAIELALKQLIKIHPSSANMRDYFQGGKVKHWCNDPFAIGACSLFIPFQETELLDKLQASISNVHFIGEHTSLVHAWVEGAVVSALRPALLISAQAETTFDVIIVGGGPIGLITAVFLSLKEPALHIVIVEQGTVMNSDGRSSVFDQRQYRQMYDEEYLAELANVSFPLWRQLEQMANMSLGSILNTDDGYLFLSDFNGSQSSVEDDLQSTKRICEQRQMGCEYLNSTQLQARYPTFTFSRQHQGIFHNQSGYINVNTLMLALVRIIAQNPNIIIREQEQFLSLKLDNQTQIVTDRGVLRASRKVLFVPGPYAKHVSRLLNFDLNITLWELPVYYFRLLPNANRFPTWFSRGGSDLQSLFSGFPIVSSSDYIAVLPGFIPNLFNTLIHPSQRANMIDPFITQKVIEWVSQHMAMQVNASDYYVINGTYLATVLPDNGILLDYVPQTNNQVLIKAAGWGMEFVPVWGDILSEMILFNNDDTMKTSSKYAKYMEYFSLSRPNRLINDATATSNE
ncbi:unnamed protein product [Rotaria sp. Silwood1]|nr:unnamed protein product [Rotaria sp. Silwood1]CAF4929868.1 unnamed protein product [Rotaria sp. Silwood1]